MKALILSATLAAAALTLAVPAMAKPLTDPAMAPPLLTLPQQSAAGEVLQIARRGRGTDDAPGHVRRGRGADDPAGHA